MKPTLTLRERLPGEHPLAKDDIAFLLDHASHLRLSPSRRPGYFRLMPTRLVGMIEAPSCRIVIRPKLPLRSLAFLLDPDASHASYESSGIDRDTFRLLDFLAMRLTQRINEQARLGLQHGYREQTSSGSYLQGRLDIPAQLRDLPRHDVLHSHRDDWTPDILCNQLLRSSLEMLVRSPFLGESGRSLIEQTLTQLNGISSINPTSAAFLLASGSTPTYRAILELAQSAVEGLMPVAGQPGPGTSFLLDLEHLFERYITQGFREAYPLRGFTVREQETITLPPLLLRPDVIVSEGSSVRLVVDAKWKLIRSGSVKPGDFYQILTYAVTLKAERVVLVYPDSKDALWTISIPNASSCIEVRTLRVTSTPVRNLRSLAQLVQTLLPVRL